MGFCDLCEQVGHPCPGLDKHCSWGYHCTAVIEICSIDESRQDHSERCCHCGADTGTVPPTD